MSTRISKTDHHPVTSAGKSSLDKTMFGIDREGSNPVTSSHSLARFKDEKCMKSCCAKHLPDCIGT